MKWYEIEPADAVDIDLTQRLDIDAPLTEEGERCPWPWEPQQLKGVPMGMYHCGYCGTMCVAGIPHPDYRCQECQADNCEACPGFNCACFKHGCDEAERRDMELHPEDHQQT